MSKEETTNLGRIFARDSRVIAALQKHVRVNNSTNTVEIYDDYGVKLVLRDLDQETLNAFRHHYTEY